MGIALYSLTLLFLLLHPSDTVGHATQALRIWGENVVPILFPYMVFSRLLCHRLRALRMPASPLITLFGLMGGSPSGASIIAASANQLSSRTLHALSALCGTVSPMFILGTLETWTHDAKLCHRLLSIHWLCAILSAGIVWCFSRNTEKPSIAIQTLPSFSFTQSIAQSIDAILQVGGCIITCSVLAGMLEKLFLPQSIWMSLLHASLEISGGLHTLCQNSLSLDLKYILLSAALGFGSISLLAQNHAVLSPVGISMPRLLFFALVRMVLSAAVSACQITLL